MLQKIYSNTWSKVCLALLIAGGIFVLGWNFGNGTISVPTSFSGLKSIQKGTPTHLNLAAVNREYSILRQEYDGQLNQQKLLDGMMHGLASATGDPYTEYFTAKEASQFTHQLNGTFSGIGAEIGKKGSDIVIISPLSGYPAAQAGLKANDVIQAVNGKSVLGMTVDSVVTKIRGPKNSTVKLTIRRNGTVMHFSIVRKDITAPSVNYQILKGNIGYMQITQFNNDTSRLATKAANDFRDHNVKGIILDLRGNPGGILNAAVNVSSMWLNSNKTILTERRGGKIIQTYTSNGSAILKGIPTVVLINGGSASAAEITAGALRDNGAALLMGTQSFGKGSVQQINDLPGGAMMKVTIARWYTPDGHNIDKQGLTPNKIVTITPADIKSGVDTQKQAAIHYLASK